MLDEASTERAADRFAECVLMPRRVVRRCWRLKIRHPVALAELYEVDEKAIRVRLRQLGLTRRRRPRGDDHLFCRLPDQTAQNRLTRGRR